jgi:hypothetical protein
MAEQMDWWVYGLGRGKLTHAHLTAVFKNEKTGEVTTIRGADIVRAAEEVRQQSERPGL